MADDGFDEEAAESVVNKGEDNEGETSTSSESNAASFAIDRSAIAQDRSLLDEELALLGEHVAVYAQETLEQGFLSQVDQALEQQSKSQPPSKEASKFAQIVTAKTDDRVRFGDLTPFELSAKQQKSTDDDDDDAADQQNDEKPQSSYASAAKSDDDDQSEKGSASGSEYAPSDAGSSDSVANVDDDIDINEEIELKPSSSKKSKIKVVKKRAESSKVFRLRDDGDEKTFEKRMKALNQEVLKKQIETDVYSTDDLKAHELRGGLQVPQSIWSRLYKYQKTGVRWLWELDQQSVGGVMGDEMGLGKTIQIISFLASLARSQLPVHGFSWKGLGPTLIICPTTVMYQWVKEFQQWSPKCRVAVFHQTGSYRGPKQRLISKMATARKDGSVLITSYSTMTKERKLLLQHEWHYVVLDEGHMIRNPEAQITLAVKELRTPHRLIMSGSPLQNSLKELWSLIDFIYPGRLGSLKTFTEQFSIPITQGGYANATAVQVRTAYKCACVLRDAINPYLLRRMKKDVQVTLQLPTKSEQVLFCDITDEQRALYKDYLMSRECERILSGGIDAFVGLILLRKLCNHPDLVTGGPNKHGDYDVSVEPDKAFGHASRSGKMIVVQALLRLWHKQGHKVLLFSQSRQMLTILENFVKGENYTSMRMDGTTGIGSRQTLVNKFNEDPNIFVFLLTTRVGGLGVNLTGANRVLIYDPDWNPSTDMQARERAWRIGQDRPVTIYRLLTGGTIEEKIYHRQIFKQFLTNRILADPKQRRFFKTNDLHELFTLGDEKVGRREGTETAALFAGTGSVVVPGAEKGNNYFDEQAKKHGDDFGKRKKQITTEDDEDIDFAPSQLLSREKVDHLKQLAKKLSKRLPPAKATSSNLSKKEEKEEKREKKRHKKAVLFEGEHQVPFLKKQTAYRPVNDADEDDEELSKKQDDYVLTKLFKCSSVHSALSHDHIVAAGDPDFDLVEGEAEKVAKRAAATIKRARHSFNDPANGGPSTSKRPRFGPKTTSTTLKPVAKQSGEDATALFSGDFLVMKKSVSTAAIASTTARSDGSDTAECSQSLLSAIRARKDRSLVDDASDQSSDGDDDYPSLRRSEASSVAVEPSRFDKVATELRTFLALKDGQAKTAEIIDKFQQDVPKRDSVAFRAILKRLCDFRRAVDSKDGVWVLKDEYR